MSSERGDAVRCDGAADTAWPIRVATKPDVEISWLSIVPTKCERCAQLRTSSLLTPVAFTDLPYLRPGRVVFVCRGCGTSFVRPDGR